MRVSTSDSMVDVRPLFNVKHKIPLSNGLYCARNQKEKEEEAKWEEGAFSCIRDDLNHAN